LYGGVDLPGVLMLPNLDTVFMIPERIAASPLMTILDKFTGNFAQSNLAKWQALTQLQSKKPTDIVTVGLVAKYMENKDTYLSVTEALKSAAWHENVGLHIKWLNAETVTERDFETVDALLPRLLQVLMHLADEFLLRNPGSAGREDVRVDPQSPAVVHPEVDHPEFHEPLRLRLRHLYDRRMKGDDPDEFFRRHTPSLEVPGLIPAAQHSNSEIPLSGHETALGAAKPDSSATKRGFRDTP